MDVNQEDLKSVLHDLMESLNSRDDAFKFATIKNATQELIVETRKRHLDKKNLEGFSFASSSSFVNI